MKLGKITISRPAWNKGKITISCPKCGLDRGKEVGGIGEACPKCGFKPKREIIKGKVKKK